MAIGAPGGGGDNSLPGYAKVYQIIEGVWLPLGNSFLGEAARDGFGSSVSLSGDGRVLAIGGSGRVRVFRNAFGGTWEQVGGDLAKDTFGGSVSLNREGTIVAVGAVGNDGNGEDSGLVRVFRNVDGDWLKIGDDLQGVSAGDWFGSSVSLNGDGTVVAVGAAGNDDNGEFSGHVRVFRFEAGFWAQLGDPIEGQASRDFLGLAISLSDDGDVLAVASANNDEKGTNTGHARIFKYQLGAWEQLGEDIYGDLPEGRFGESVSLSGDGGIVAVGSPQQNVNGVNSGKTRFYWYRSSAWTQLGDDLDGQAGDYSGAAVAISGDGTTALVGSPLSRLNGGDSGHVDVVRLSESWERHAPGIESESPSLGSGLTISLSNDGSVMAIGELGNDDNGEDSGSLRVYRNVSGEWEQLGQDIDGEAEGDAFGSSVSLSADGLVVAIGATENDGNGEDSGHVRVFRNVDGDWLKIGDDLQGVSAGDRFGSSVSLNGDGDILAIGALGHDGNGRDSGLVRIYRNQGGSWTQVGGDIYGEAAGDALGIVSLSRDGMTVAAGAFLSNGNGFGSGRVRVFRQVSGTWSQIGQSLDGESADDSFGWELSLSADGNTLLVGAPFNDGNGSNSGHVSVFTLVFGIWEQIGPDIEGELENGFWGSSVSLSGDGRVVATTSSRTSGINEITGFADSFTFVGLAQKPPLIENPEWDYSTGFRASLSLQKQKMYRIQSSTNLRDWRYIDGFVSESTEITIEDPEALDSGRKFYRVASP